MPKLLLAIFFLLLANPAYAVTNPATGSATVTASVPESVAQPPDTPVLISPKNNSVINTTAPNFIFNPSLGAIEVSHYQLWLDGVKNTDHISRSSITIIARALNSLSEGLHTWMIKAIGMNTHDRDSAIWSFTIDTTAPLILVNQVAEHTPSLSSLDLTTIPPGLTFTTANRLPVISGQSEANATLTLTLNNLILTAYTTNTTFKFIPSANLAYGTYTVSITSTDASGNVTILPSFKLTINRPQPITITFPKPFPTLTLPPLPGLPVLPALPKALTAFPLTTGIPAWLTYLSWFIIITLLTHIWLLLHLPITQYTYQKLSLYITLFIPCCLLLYYHLFLSLLALALLIYEIKLIQK
ncbi:MAG: Ig-like domain-containing protein [Patescibacteria group bacterium]